MKAGGRAVFELAPLGASGEDLLAPEQEMGWMVKLSDDLDLPVSFTLLQIDAAPDAWRGLMDESLRARRCRGRRSSRRSRRGRSGCCSASRPVTASAVVRRTASSRRASRPTSCSPSWPRPQIRAQILVRGRCRPRPRGAVRRVLPARAGFARPPLRARRPAGLRADPRPHRSRRWPRRPASIRWRCSTTSCSSTARSTCSCCRSSTTPSATTTPSARCCCTPVACRACPTVARTAG